ncbi:lipoprotein [Spiroplasma endosymbiont of Ammophila pubescens]|uniref:lipoprotein n=1 Tax=Spiroplasma endosymbiont of Ammophila pubescens TaxID=3066315 RepID=UPI0032B1028F
MKKWLSILGAIGLTATSTTTLISCEKLNNNENGGGNKPEPWNQQQTPKNSNWKLIENNNRESEFSKPNNKWYFYVRIIDKYICEKVYFDSNFIKNHNTY